MTSERASDSTICLSWCVAEVQEWDGHAAASETAAVAVDSLGRAAAGSGTLF